MPEGMSADMPESSSERCASEFLPYAGVGIWQVPDIERTRKNPIIGFTKTSDLLPPF